MKKTTTLLSACLSVVLFLVAGNARAELLVAPTRIELTDDQQFAELTVVNKGAEEAAFRIGLENRRMREDGSLEEAKDTNEGEMFARDLLRYAPRRVILAAGEKQTIRISVKPGMAPENGEYRSHLRLMSVPVSAGRQIASAKKEATDSLSIQLIAIRSLTIPIIFRAGDLTAKVGLSEVFLRETEQENETLLVAKMTRDGTKSTYGNVLIYRNDDQEPIFSARGIAIYTPNDKRDVILPIPDALREKIEGESIRVVYLDSTGDAPAVLAEAEMRLEVK